MRTMMSSCKNTKAASGTYNPGDRWRCGTARGCRIATRPSRAGNGAGGRRGNSDLSCDGELGAEDVSPRAAPAAGRARRAGLGLVILWIGFSLDMAAHASTAVFLQKFATSFSLESPEVPRAVMSEAKPRAWSGESGPVPGLGMLAKESSGALWLAGDPGAARFDPHATYPWERWQYFAGPRWLPDDAVQNVVVEETNQERRVWIRTRTGVARIDWRPMTLEEKARLFEERIEQRHVRHGLVADSRLLKPGDLSTSQPSDSDNDGLWTAIYLGAMAYRYAATGEPQAREHARRALQAILRLEEITDRPGFYARSFVSMSEPKPGGGEWHPTADGQWLWKGDTSSDESVGHYFAYSTYYDLVADEAEKAEIRRVVGRMTDHLLAHDYNLVDLDGQPTRWGQWSESYFKTEEGQYEAALRSLELLSFLKTTWHITGREQYRRAYEDRLERGYAEHAGRYRRWPGGGEINFSDDELAYLSYLPLLRYEQDPKLREVFLDGLRFTWSRVRADRNPLWNYISVACGAGPMTPEIRDESRRTLQRIPMSLVDWPVRNSHRLDVRFQNEADRFGRPQMISVLPPDESPVGKWNKNPYRADGGGGGHSEEDGGFFLLPYWMGRYFGWVE